MQSIDPEIHVACAIIWKDNRILLSKRAEDSDFCGLWEFPGGKFRLDESPSECLARELFEELGIVPLEQQYMFRLVWDYGDRRLCLWIFEVFQFDGEPQSCEGQAIEWFDQNGFRDLNFPEANGPILRAIGLPRLARFYSVDCHPDPVSWISQIETRSLIYFRGIAPTEALTDAIDEALKLNHAVILTLDQLACHRQGVGVHLRKTDNIDDALISIQALQDPWPITCGLRSLDNIQLFSAWPCDAFFISPVFSTPTHKNMKSLGWDGFKMIASAVNRPVYALGGITPEDISDTTRHFGFGVAGIRGF